tara:strand:+ start:405 stop:623 length:219 start_codon:yes stop_codon:yes gene_type:complete
MRIAIHYTSQFKQRCREVGIIYLLTVAVVSLTFLVAGLDALHPAVRLNMSELADLEMPAGYPGTDYLSHDIQ